MKNLLIALLVAVALSSCQQRERVIIPTMQQNFGFCGYNGVAYIVSDSLYMIQGNAHYHIPMSQVWDFVVSADGLTCEVTVEECGVTYVFNK